MTVIVSRRIMSVAFQDTRGMVVRVGTIDFVLDPLGVGDNVRFDVPLGQIRKTLWMVGDQR